MGLKGYKFLYTKKKSAKEFLFNGSLIPSDRLKKKLLDEGIKENKCEKCKKIKWNGEPIPLELHHIDGNRFNNSLENIKILCPNCHAQTSNYSLKRKLEIVKIEKFKYCECGKKIKIRSKKCQTCDKINQRKIKERPSLNVLLEDVSNMSYISVGKKYGVTDNCIKKWIKSYGEIPPSKRK